MIARGRKTRWWKAPLYGYLGIRAMLSGQEDWSGGRTTECRPGGLWPTRSPGIPGEIQLIAQVELQCLPEHPGQRASLGLRFP